MRRKKNIKACHYSTISSKLHHQAGITTVPVEIVRLEDNSYHLIVKVEIDGLRGEMIIDTGASVTVIDQKLFPGKEEDETTVKMQSGSVTGQIDNVHLIKAKEFKIGGRKIRNMQLASIDLKYVNDMYDKHLQRKIIGLLGCDFCVKYKVVINYRTKEISLTNRL